MRLKTFHATTLKDAMQMIRDVMGDDAVIVSTGEDRRNGGVKVTAAVEPAFELHSEDYDDGASWLQYDDEQDGDAVVEELTDILLKHAVPEDVMDHMISCATVMGFDDVGVALCETLEQFFTYDPLPDMVYSAPIMMVGPPGAGKTLAVAKLAARHVMNDLNVHVVSTDTMRAGGFEQLESFTRLLNVPLHRCESHQDMRRIMSDLRHDGAQIIIDTPGINPFDKDEVKFIAKLIAVAQGRTAFALPAGLDADEAGEMARVFATIGATDLLPTRVDMARRLGSVLSAAHQGGLNFSDVSDTPKVAQGLSPVTPTSLATLLHPRLYKSKGQQTPQPRKTTHNAHRYRAGTTQ